jgi:hypothetical protein
MVKVKDRVVGFQADRVRPDLGLQVVLRKLVEPDALQGRSLVDAQEQARLVHLAPSGPERSRVTVMRGKFLRIDDMLQNQDSVINVSGASVWRGRAIGLLPALSNSPFPGSYVAVFAKAWTSMELARSHIHLAKCQNMHG